FDFNRGKRSAGINIACDLAWSAANDEAGIFDLAAADADFAFLVARPAEELAVHHKLDPGLEVPRGHWTEHRSQRQHQRDRAERPCRIVIGASNRPAAERLEDRRSLLTPGRKLRDLPRGGGRNPRAAQYAGRFQPLEPLRQNVGTNPVETRFKVGE